MLSRTRCIRSAFTLIELLVVIAIIAILVSLTAAAVMRALWKLPEVQTSTDIAKMSVALQAFMSDFSLDSPPPSTLNLNEANPSASGSVAFLKKAFGKNVGVTIVNNQPVPLPIDWNGNGKIDGSSTGWNLTGEQCLVFYLGGIGNRGFSYNGQNPTPVAGQRTHGPYYTFETNRLVAGTGGFLMYLDAWKVKTGPKPYAYFSSQGINNKYSLTDCADIGSAPYFSGSLVSPTFMNPTGYQIISAGADGTFGNTTNGVVPWNPASGATGAGGDDQANFSSTLLKAGQQ